MDDSLCYWFVERILLTCLMAFRGDEIENELTMRVFKVITSTLSWQEVEFALAAKSSALLCQFPVNFCSIPRDK